MAGQTVLESAHVRACSASRYGHPLILYQETLRRATELYHGDDLSAVQATNNASGAQHVDTKSVSADPRRYQFLPEWPSGAG